MRIGVFLVLAFFLNIFIMYGQFVNLITWVQLFHFLRVPPGINCDQVLQLFGDDLPQMAFVEERYHDLSQFPEYLTFNEFRPYLYLNQRISRTGALDCLCKSTDNYEKSYNVTMVQGEVVQE